ncbi:hypothetical protein DZF91_16145 [Actinomadura logoneensis]|uniref:Extracellular repeat, HAF family n=1 Tax=Actinomadura logoneensis TaxID=2293572 RepID=A0A372JKU9_9ACTN|nr:hypothetical protein [Actinomadura logoneensis]RFU40625.1 hypothetical protein DZF91_16145 [Actinomadura logoneensis]
MKRSTLAAVLTPLVVIVSLLIPSQPASAQEGRGYLRQPDGHFTAIDVPGAVGTMPMGINNRGDIAGSYDDSSGRSHAFTLRNGHYTTIDHPNATGDKTPYGLSGTLFSGINDRGEIVGSYVGHAGRIHGFRYSHGAFTPIDVPGAQEVWPFGINNRGQVTVQTVRPDGSQPQYLLDAGHYTPIAFPGAAYTIAHRINDHGTIVGDYVDTPDATTQHAFIRTRGTYTRFDVPGAAYTGINATTNRGDLVGYYVPENSETGHAFIITAGKFTTFDAPGAAGTTAFDINDKGQTVGTGFTASKSFSRAVISSNASGDRHTPWLP